MLKGSNHDSYIKQKERILEYSSFGCQYLLRKRIESFVFSLNLHDSKVFMPFSIGQFSFSFSATLFGGIMLRDPWPTGGQNPAPPARSEQATKARERQKANFVYHFLVNEIVDSPGSWTCPEQQEKKKQLTFQQRHSYLQKSLCNVFIILLR